MTQVKFSFTFLLMFLITGVLLLYSARGVVGGKKFKYAVLGHTDLLLNKFSNSPTSFN